ncbi:MAG: chemotaxis protein CheY [Frankiales bacterium]|nr:chemotaxis protein CheY [Frankiales bacterium]
MIRTLVVDDDHLAADILAATISQVAGFSLCGVAHTAAHAFDAIGERAPDLVLLDLYLPDEGGLALLRRVRALLTPPDVIVVSAARDVDSVRTAMQLGALHYLVKPVTPSRLGEQLTAYRALQESVGQLAEASQADVDKLYGLMHAPVADPLPVEPAGPTMTRILQALRTATAELTAAELAGQVGVSRATAQRYLAQLLRAGVVELDVHYGAPGRPANRYRTR